MVAAKRNSKRGSLAQPKREPNQNMQAHLGVDNIAFAMGLRSYSGGKPQGARGAAKDGGGKKRARAAGEAPLKPCRLGQCKQRELVADAFGELIAQLHEKQQVLRQKMASSLRRTEAVEAEVSLKQKDLESCRKAVSEAMEYMQELKAKESAAKDGQAQKEQALLEASLQRAALKRSVMQDMAPRHMRGEPDTAHADLLNAMRFGAGKGQRPGIHTGAYGSTAAVKAKKALEAWSCCLKEKHESSGCNRGAGALQADPDVTIDPPHLVPDLLRNRPATRAGGGRSTRGPGGIGAASRTGGVRPATSPIRRPRPLALLPESTRDASGGIDKRLGDYWPCGSETGLVRLVAL